MIRRALVTGASGLIGRAVRSCLVAAGADVDVWDLASSPPIDVTQPPPVTEDYDVVFHLAANTENRAASLGGVVASLTGLAGVLDVLRRRPPGAIVFTSSQLVYAAGENQAETAAPSPQSGFAAGKLAGEILLSAFSREVGVPSVSCRLCNVIGPKVQRGIVRDLVNRIGTTAGPDLTILGDGSQKRSYLLAEDCAAALILIGQNTTWPTVNVGNVDAITALEVAATVVAASGRDLRPTPATGTGWATDPGTLTMDIGRLRSLGWTPGTSSAEAVAHSAVALLTAREGTQ